MKNILVTSSSHDGTSAILVDDLDKLDENNQEQKDVKDALCWMLDENKTSTWAKFGYYECDKYGIFDTGGYSMNNTLHDVYGFKRLPYTVEHMVEVKCDI